MNVQISQDRFHAGRTALITGMMSGQTLVIAKVLASHGANVSVGLHLATPGMVQENAAYYPGAEEIQQVRAKPESFGTKAPAAHLDLRDTNAIEISVTESQSAVGSIDILVNAAGTTVEQGMLGQSEALWERILDTNLNGAC